MFKEFDQVTHLVYWGVGVGESSTAKMMGRGGGDVERVDEVRGILWRRCNIQQVSIEN